MEAFINISLPIFGIMLIGFLTARSGMFENSGAKSLNIFVYYIALPALFIKAIATAPPQSFIEFDFIAAMALGYLCTGLISVIIAQIFFVKTIRELALHSGTAIFGNTGYMGIPLLLIAFGEAHAHLIIIAVLVNIILVFTGILIFLEYDQLHQKMNLQQKRAYLILGNIIKKLAKNPLILATLMGLFLMFLPIPMPVAALRLLELLGAASIPCALFAMGVFIAQQKLTEGSIEIFIVSLVKLFIHPFITFLWVEYYFELSSIQSSIAVIMAALPTGALMFLLADMYNIYRQRAAGVIILSTIGAVATVSYVLHYYQI